MKRSAVAVAVAVAAIAALLGVRNAVVDAPLERLREVEPNVYEGSWQFPRGGPYILGFENGRALFIDGVRLATRPHRTDALFLHQWKLYEPGAHAVRFEAEPGGRLLWHPPGRRGPAEYVAPSSLAPSPPQSASFAAPGTSRADGVFAALIGLLLAGLALYLVRDRLRRIDRRTAICFGGVFGLALAVRLIGLSAAGQTFDEDVNWSAGRNYITNLLSLDFAQDSWRFNYQHPPVMKYIAGVGAQFADGYGPARALSAIVMALACALLVPIGRRLYDGRVGALAGGIAAVTPHLVAHGKIVGHEAPSVLWWTLGVWLCLRAHDGADTPARLARRFAVIGVVLGVAIFSRFSNGLLAPLLGILLVIHSPREQLKHTVWLGIAVIPWVALAVGCLIWPRLWVAPIEHTQQAWAILNQLHGAEPYLGVLVGTENNPAPWHYFFVYFVATAPVAMLAGAIVCTARWREWRSGVSLLAWILVPMAMLLSPVKQDGVRYILPAVAALAVASAAGFAWVADRFGHRHSLVAIGGALAIYFAVVNARIHPYYLDYYGELAGGPARVSRHKSFETAWWGEGIDRAIDYLNEHAEPGAVVDKRHLQPGHVTWMRYDLWKPRVQRGPWPSPTADWVLLNDLSVRPFNAPPDLELVFELEAQGAPLVRVYRR